MPNPNIPLPSQNMQYEDFRRYVGEVVNRLNYLFKNIEGLNIKEMTFDLTGGAYITINRKGIVINDGAKDTLKVDIDGNLTIEGVIKALGGIIGGWTIGPDKLSGAGKIEGGTIVGSEIKTAEDAFFPRVELSSSNDLIQLLSNLNQYIRVVVDETSGIPTLFFKDGLYSLAAYLSSGGTFHFATPPGIIGAHLRLYGGDNLILEAFNKVLLSSWAKLSNGTQNLQEALNAKANSFSGYTGSFSTGTQTVFVSNGIITAVV